MKKSTAVAVLALMLSVVPAFTQAQPPQSRIGQGQSPSFQLDTRFQQSLPFTANAQINGQVAIPVPVSVAPSTVYYRPTGLKAIETKVDQLQAGQDGLAELLRQSDARRDAQVLNLQDQIGRGNGTWLWLLAIVALILLAIAAFRNPNVTVTQDCHRECNCDHGCRCGGGSGDGKNPPMANIPAIPGTSYTIAQAETIHRVIHEERLDAQTAGSIKTIIRVVGQEARRFDRERDERRAEQPKPTTDVPIK